MNNIFSFQPLSTMVSLLTNTIHNQVDGHIMVLTPLYVIQTDLSNVMKSCFLDLLARKYLIPPCQCLCPTELRICTNVKEPSLATFVLVTRFPNYMSQVRLSQAFKIQYYHTIVSCTKSNVPVLILVASSVFTYRQQQEQPFGFLRS